MKNKEKKDFIYWFPRIGGIVYACFLMLFSFDVFDIATGFWQILGAFIMHSIPSIVLFIIVWIAWKREMVGAITFILFAVAYWTVTIFNVPILMAISWSMIITGPSFLIGICFLLGWKRKRDK